jgi:hypothetical protein
MELGDQQETRRQSERTTPREYVQACIDIANWHEGEDFSSFFTAACRVSGGMPGIKDAKGPLSHSAKKALFAAWQSMFRGDRGLRYADYFRECLASFLYRQGADRKSLRDRAEAALKRVVVKTQLKLGPRGELEHQHQYVPHGTASEGGLLLAFLFSPNEPFKNELRQCPYCERFFLAAHNPKGGPRPKYCPGTDHQKLNDAMQAAFRVSENRQKKGRK